MATYQFKIWEDISDKTSRRFLNLFAKVKGDILSEPETSRTILINISSDGGEVEPGLAIYDMIQDLKSLGVAIVTLVHGKAYSCAAVLTLAGHTRICMPNASLMFHPISFAMGEDYIHHQESAIKMTGEINNKLYAIIQRELKLTNAKMEKLKQKIKHTYWLNAQEAMGLGIIHQIGLSNE